jgi:hypothetical protein
MLAVIYVFGICVVATILFVAVDDLEPNRRYASVLKFLIVFASIAALVLCARKLLAILCTVRFRSDRRGLRSDCSSDGGCSLKTLR